MTDPTQGLPRHDGADGRLTHEGSFECPSVKSSCRETATQGARSRVLYRSSTVVGTGLTAAGCMGPQSKTSGARWKIQGKFEDPMEWRSRSGRVRAERRKKRRTREMFCEGGGA